MCLKGQHLVHCGFPTMTDLSNAALNADGCKRCFQLLKGFWKPLLHPASSFLFAAKHHEKLCVCHVADVSQTTKALTRLSTRERQSVRELKSLKFKTFAKKWRKKHPKVIFSTLNGLNPSVLLEHSNTPRFYPT